MSDPLQVKVSRAGKEIGTYGVEEAVQLLQVGTLKPTDFYWHKGMTEWAPLSKLQVSEVSRQLSERAIQQEEAIKAEMLAREKAKAKQNEDAISAAAHALWVKKMASERLDKNSGLDRFKALGPFVLVIGLVVLVSGLAGDDAGSAIRQQVRTLQMTNGILLMILGCIISK